MSSPGPTGGNAATGRGPAGNAGTGATESTGFIMAIDGPAGTGKSTVARLAAQALSAGYLDTGAMYRIVTLAVLGAGVDPHDDAAVAALLPGLSFDSPVNAGRQQHALGGRDVTAEIRGDDVTVAVTPVSANPAVRRYLLERQRTLARSGRMVVEGRDIGTVVVPDADVKVYLTADAEERARRRYRQNAGARARAGRLVSTADSADPAADLAAVALDLDRRDSRDSTRPHAPLQAAGDAVVIDSSGMQVQETVAEVLALARQRGIW